MCFMSVFYVSFTFLAVKKASTFGLFTAKNVELLGLNHVQKKIKESPDGHIMVDRFKY